MTTLYKLTALDKTTCGNTLWGEGVTHTADGKSRKLCNEHWIHAYRDRLVAAMLAPAYLHDGNYIMWTCEGDVGLDHADKCGCTSLTTLRQVEVPKITTAQRQKFAQLIVFEVYPLWAKYDQDGIVGKWLRGDESITANAARTAAETAAAAAGTAATRAWVAAKTKTQESALTAAAAAHAAVSIATPAAWAVAGATVRTWKAAALETWARMTARAAAAEWSSLACQRMIELAHQAREEPE